MVQGLRMTLGRYLRVRIRQAVQIRPRRFLFPHRLKPVLHPMPTFLDSKNRTWAVELTVGGLLRWREAKGPPDPMDIPAAVDMLYRDPLKSAQAMAAVIGPALAAANCTPGDFLAALTGEHAAAMQAVLLEEYRRFFVQPALVAVLKSAEAATALEVARKATIQLTSRETCGTPCGGPPASPDKTHDLGTPSPI